MSEIWWLVWASVVVNLGFMLFTYRALRRRSESFHDGEYDERLTRLREEVADLITDINRTINGNLNVMEERTAELKKLTNEATKKIMKLNSLITDAEIAMGRAAGAMGKSRGSFPEAAEEGGGDGGGRGSKYEKVLELYNMGLDAAEISHRTKVGLAEVKLILGLSRQ
jgi:hypothetical protein